MARTTPGPWNTRDACFSNDIAIVAKLGPNQYAMLAEVFEQVQENVYLDTAETSANARLIAAAPDLLEASEAAKEIIDDCDPAYCGEDNKRWFAQKMELINTAIAKAKEASDEE